MALPEEPGGREPAPGALRLIQEFVNSRIIEGGTDDWPTPEALAAFLAGRGLLGRGEELGERDLAWAKEVREALRGVLRANNGSLADPDQVAALTRAAQEAQLFVRFRADGQTRMDVGATGLAGALGRVIAVVHGAMADGTFARLKACRRDVCQWVFYDQSKNRSGSWCSMSICGNREKSSTYYRRRRGAGT